MKETSNVKETVYTNLRFLSGGTYRDVVSHSAKPIYGIYFF